MYKKDIDLNAKFKRSNDDKLYFMYIQIHIGHIGAQKYNKIVLFL